MRLVDLSEAAYPGPWDGHGAEYISGPESPKDSGDIICDMPSEGEDSRRNWPANRAFIIAAANFVRDLIQREQEARRALAEGRPASSGET